MQQYFNRLKQQWNALKARFFRTTSAIATWIIQKFSAWVLRDEPPRRKYLSDFKQICFEVKPADVLLIEGRNHISHIIQYVTHSPWTHAVLYIGQLSNIEDPALRTKIKEDYHYSPSTQLIIESDIGVGTIVSPLSKYKDDHIRLLRPNGLSHRDSQKVVAYAASRLGTHYDLRHLFDLARFLFPWSLFPRRFRTTLFAHNALQPTKDICSSMLADAFASVKFPILPMVSEGESGLELTQRNSRLFTPSDFDYSPYFAVIKYPIFPMNSRIKSDYLPWRQETPPSNQ